jgi:hypothetical protein
LVKTSRLSARRDRGKAARGVNRAERDAAVGSEASDRQPPAPLRTRSVSPNSVNGRITASVCGRHGALAARWTSGKGTRSREGTPG